MIRTWIPVAALGLLLVLSPAAHSMAKRPSGTLEAISRTRLGKHFRKSPGLEKPLLLSPSGHTRKRRPLYRWRKVKGATGYALIVMEDSPGHVPLYIRSGIKRTHIKHPWWKRLRRGRRYFFVVIAYNRHTKKRSPLSERMCFRVVGKQQSEPSPPTVKVVASASSLLPGEALTLSWQSSGADTLSIEPAVGEVAAQGELTLFPSADTTYTVTASGPGGVVSETVKVSLIFPPEDTDWGMGGDEQRGGGGLLAHGVRITNANLIDSRTDISLPSPNTMGLRFRAYYNSHSCLLGALGWGWTHTYALRLDPGCRIKERVFLRVVDETGRAHYFVEDPVVGIYRGIFKERSSVEKDPGGYFAWQRLDGRKYLFDTEGKLSSVEDQRGNRLLLLYNEEGLLGEVQDEASSRRLRFKYDEGGRVLSIEGPGASGAETYTALVSFAYDENTNLTSVTYPDKSGYIYSYTDPGDIHHLTEKRDTEGHLLCAWSYDEGQRVVSSMSGDGRGVEVDYQAQSNKVVVRDAYGVEREYVLKNIDGRWRFSKMSGPGGAPYTERSSIASWDYDSEMRVVQTKTLGGTITRYADYDQRGNPQKVVLAYGTPSQRTLVMSYHPRMSVPLSLREASVLGSVERVTIWDYDIDDDSVPNENPGNLLRRIVEKGFTWDDEAEVVPYEYITTFSYNQRGQVVAVDGPLPGSEDITTFSYDSKSGDLLSITRPLVGESVFSGYDGRGRVGKVTDVNGTTTLFSYDGRGRVVGIVNGADSSSTAIEYTPAGKVRSVTDPDGVTTRFSYDPHYGRLTRVEDPEGNYIVYAYDGEGNRTRVSKNDPGGVITYTRSWDYHHPQLPGKLYREINPDGSFTQYDYDSEGRVVSVKDPNGNSTYYQYDALGRLTTIIQPENVVTSYSYDTHGNLATLTDPNGNKTGYTYDDMGRLLQSVSPDRGTLTYSYDSRGRVLTKTDSRGIRIHYTYDLLGRVTGVHFPDPGEDIAYSYDQGENAKGHLTGISDASGETSFFYDERGRLSGKESTIDGISYTFSRTYSPAGRALSATYPSGRTITYTRDTFGKIEGVSTAFEGTSRPLLSNISYLPFGPAFSFALGGTEECNTVFDKLYRVKVVNPGAKSECDYVYDPSGSIISVVFPSDPKKDQAYSYDSLNRLVGAEGPFGIVAYEYDAAGNRLRRVVNNEVETYSYIEGSSRLNQIDTGGIISFAYDDTGNTTAIGDLELNYNQGGRLLSSEKPGALLAEYTYNALGQRVKKETGTQSSIFHYDLSGNLIAESSPDGTFLSEYLYAGTNRLAMIECASNDLYYFANDHLGTPLLMTDESGRVVWEATYTPFGEASVNPHSTVVNNFRLPGQYYDPETALYYNYHRDYDPRSGRYIEPDPIGLKGGMNLYAYASNNPTNLVDPSGEFVITGIVIARAAIGAFSGGLAGFAAGMKSGHVWAAVIGGAMGGLAGGVIGVLTPAASTIVGGMVGGAVAGLLGGAFGGYAGKYLITPDAPLKEALLSAAKGAAIGIVTGGIAGGLATAAVGVGAAKAAADLAGAMASAPIAMGLGMVNIEGFLENELLAGTTIPGTYEYPYDWFPELQFDPDNPDQIEPGTSATLTVTGGMPPYAWSVTGDGFSFENEETWLSWNNLVAYDSACGSAQVEVVDSSGARIITQVRSTAGEWIYHGWDEAETGDPTCFVCGDSKNPVSREIIEGGKRWLLYSIGPYHDQCSTPVCTGSDWKWKNLPPPPCGTPWTCWDGPPAYCSSCWFGAPHYGYYGRYSYYTWGCTGSNLHI